MYHTLTVAGGKCTRGNSIATAGATRRFALITAGLIVVVALGDKVKPRRTNSMGII